MYYCIIDKGEIKIVQCTDTKNAPTGSDYAFELSSAGSQAEAEAITSKIGRVFSKTDSREQNIAKVERFLGLLDMLDVVFSYNWNNNFEPIRNFCRSYSRDEGQDADDVLEDIADWGGIPCGFEGFFVTHVANMLANTAIDDEEDLRRFFPDDDRSVFAAETRRCFKRLDDARN